MFLGKWDFCRIIQNDVKLKSTALICFFFYYNLKHVKWLGNRKLNKKNFFELPLETFFCCLKSFFLLPIFLVFFSPWRWNMSLSSYKKGRMLLVNFSKFKNMWKTLFGYVVNFFSPRELVRFICWLRFIFCSSPPHFIFIFYRVLEWAVEFTISFCWERGYWLFPRFISSCRSCVAFIFALVNIVFDILYIAFTDFHRWRIILLKVFFEFGVRVSRFTVQLSLFHPVVLFL